MNYQTKFKHAVTLAEGTSYGAASAHNRNYAFTLAEVLITLAIIGVVAALTLPALIQKNHANIVETRLEKFYSSINQAIKLAEVDYGDKQYWTPIDTNDFFEKYLKNYLKYTSYENKRVGYSNDWRLINLPDGSAFLVDIYATWDENGNQTRKTNGGHFIFCPVAKNCRDGMDFAKWGRTQFPFAYWPNENSASMKYHKGRGVEPYLNEWNGNETALYTHAFGCNPNAKNAYCTAIIQHNGWKIPKDYPYKF